MDADFFELLRGATAKLPLVHWPNRWHPRPEHVKYAGLRRELIHHAQYTVFLTFRQEYCSNHSQSIKALQSLREINPTLGAHLQVCSSRSVLLQLMRLSVFSETQRRPDHPEPRPIELSTWTQYVLVLYIHSHLLKGPRIVQRITRYPLLIKQVSAENSFSGPYQ